MQKGFAPIFVLVGVLVIVAVATGAYFLRKSTTVPQPSPTPAASPAPTGSGETANWKTYTNTKYGYLVKYPPQLVPQEDFSNDIYLIFVNFRDPATDKNFNITTRNAKLEKEVEFLKWSVEGHMLYTLDREEGLNFQGYPGARLSYKPQKPNEESPFTYFTVNNNKYSYTIKADTDEIDKILSTFKFLDQREMIKALDIYQNSQLSVDASKFLPNFYWPKLKPFKSGDKTREVYLVDCQVANDNTGFKLDGIPEEIPNVANVAEVTLKRLMEHHYGGFPDAEEVSRQNKAFNLNYKNKDSGINGLILKDGNLIINFYDSVGAYGGGSSRVACLKMSTELTMKQFPTIKKVTMCIDRSADNCDLDFSF